MLRYIIIIACSPGGFVVTRWRVLQNAKSSTGGSYFYTLIVTNNAIEWRKKLQKLCIKKKEKKKASVVKSKME